MNGQQKTVFVMHSDALVLKGLILLLEDLDLQVITVRNPENLDLSQTSCPDLILFPLETYKGKSGQSFVRELRTFFNARIPAILLASENRITISDSYKDNILVLSDRITPRDIRRNIKTILSNPLNMTRQFHRGKTGLDFLFITTENYFSGTYRSIDMLLNIVSLRGKNHAVFFSVIFLFLFMILSLQTAQAVRWKDTEITQLKKRADATVQNLNGIQSNLGPLNTLQDLVNVVNVNRQGLNADALELLQQAREQIESALIQQKQGLDEFLGFNDCGAGSPCEQFKQNIVGFFHNLQLMMQKLLSINPTASVDLAVDLEVFAKLIEAAPGKAVYPLYVGLTSSNNLFNIDLTAYFQQILDSLDDLQHGLVMEEPVNRMQYASRTANLPEVDIPDRCPVLMDVITPDRFGNAQKVVFGFAVFSKALAKILDSLGETGFSGMQLGVHGYIGGNLSNNRKKKAGFIIDAIADDLFLVAGHASNMLRYCTLVDNERQILELLTQN